MRYLDQLIEFARLQGKRLVVDMKKINAPRVPDDWSSGCVVVNAFNITLFMHDGRTFESKELLDNIDFSAKDILDQIREQAKTTLATLAGEVAR